MAEKEPSWVPLCPYGEDRSQGLGGRLRLRHGLIQVPDEAIHINPVRLGSLLDVLKPRSGATYAAEAVLEEYGHGLGVLLNDFAY